MTPTDQQPPTCDQVLRVAREDALKAYRDLSDYRVEIKMMDDGWHVDYRLIDTNVQGGGPHFVINPNDGTILRNRYEQ